MSSKLSRKERLSRPQEQLRQLDLIDSHEETGNLKPETAAIYRVHVLRGGNFFELVLDGPNAAECVKRSKETERALRQDGCLFSVRQRRVPKFVQVPGCRSNPSPPLGTHEAEQGARPGRPFTVT